MTLVIPMVTPVPRETTNAPRVGMYYLIEERHYMCIRVPLHEGGCYWFVDAEDTPLHVMTQADVDAADVRAVELCRRSM